MGWLALLVILLILLIVIAILIKGRIKEYLGGASVRPVLVYTKGADKKSLTQLKQTLAKLKAWRPVYDPTQTSEYSNVPVIWVSRLAPAEYQRNNPGVCSRIVLWYPREPEGPLANEAELAYTFVILDPKQREADHLWAGYSQHRYYVGQDLARHLSEALSM